MLNKLCVSTIRTVSLILKMRLVEKETVAKNNETKNTKKMIYTEQVQIV